MSEEESLHEIKKSASMLSLFQSPLAYLIRLAMISSLVRTGVLSMVSTITDHLNTHFYLFPREKQRLQTSSLLYPAASSHHTTSSQRRAGHITTPDCLDAHRDNLDFDKYFSQVSTSYLTAPIGAGHSTYTSLSHITHVSSCARQGCPCDLRS